MEYQIISSNDDKHLVEKINRLIKEGWLPQGGILMNTSPGMFEGETFTRYLQAIIKKEPTND